MYQKVKWKTAIFNNFKEFLTGSDFQEFSKNMILGYKKSVQILEKKSKTWDYQPVCFPKHGRTEWTRFCFKNPAEWRSPNSAFSVLIGICHLKSSLKLSRTGTLSSRPWLSGPDMTILDFVSRNKARWRKMTHFEFRKISRKFWKIFQKSIFSKWGIFS